MKHMTVLFVISICILNACKTVYKADPEKNAATRVAITPSDSRVNMQQKGVDFFAEGNQPVAWTLELDLEKGFYFKPANKQLLIGSPARASRIGNADVYVTQTDSGTMKLTVYDELCLSDGNSRNERKKTEVTFNNNRYNGCGSYLFDYALNDIWELEHIDNSYPELNKRQLPWMEFDLLKNEMHGFDGCNEISSDIKIEGNRIKFSVFRSTKKTCPGNESQKSYSLLNDHIVDYYIKDGQLTLILINETKLIFIRKV